MTSKALRVGVVGCGAISDVYIDNMQRRFSNLEVIACCAKHFESAQRKAQQYGLLATTFEDMLELRDIDMLVILTPAPTHYELIRRALQAGKHVYTEKMITLESRKPTNWCVWRMKNSCIWVQHRILFWVRRCRLRARQSTMA